MEKLSLKKLLKKLAPDVGRRNEEDRIDWVISALGSVGDGKKILDAGAGTQLYRKHCAHLDYVAQDFAEYDGSGDDLGLQMGEFDYGKLDIVSDITDIPCEDDSFDVILCSEVIEHVPRPRDVIREFARLLRPGGELIITAPFCSLTHFSPFHFASGFNRYWYESVFEEFGFDATELTPHGNYFDYVAQEIYRTPSMAATYDAGKLGLTGMIGAWLMLRRLAALSKQEKGSSETLCYGYLVRASKR